MLRLDVSPRAERDLDLIAADIAALDPDAARRVVRRILAVYNQLARFPQLGRLRPERPRNTRSFAVRPYPYVVYYIVHEDRIEITHVLHGSRAADAIFEDDEA